MFTTAFRFDFVQVPLFHPLFKRDHPLIIHRQGPTTRNDTVLTANDWAVLIVAKLSPWIQLESEDPVIRRQSEDVSFYFDSSGFVGNILPYWCLLIFPWSRKNCLILLSSPSLLVIHVSIHSYYSLALKRQLLFLCRGSSRRFLWPFISEFQPFSFLCLHLPVSTFHAASLGLFLPATQ